MKRYIFFAAFLVFALCLCFGIVADNTPILTGDANIDSGIYTITNKLGGENLNAFNFDYSDEGYAYIDEPSGDEGESILILKQEDGTYLLYPQNEEGKYAFFMDDNADGHVAKAEELTASSYFNISAADGGYVITNNGGLALGISDETRHKKSLVCGSEYLGGDEQKWEISAVPVTSIELKTVATSQEVRLNSVSAVYAIVKPAYMKRFVEWYSSDETVLMIDDDGTFCALGVGTATVTAKLGDVIKSIDIKVVDKSAFTWYSQNLAINGGWRGDELSGVYFQSGGTYKRFIINGHNRGLDWMDSGCFLTSIAMVLHNLGARYGAGYDFRFEADGNLEVDPYITALANSGNRGLLTPSGTLYNDPILVRYGPMEKAFTLYGQPIELVQRYDVTKASLKAALDMHPEGVIVGMKNSYNGTHYVVVTECINPNADPENYRFIIYDSAGLRASHAYNVPFELSISYDSMRYNYSHMRSMIVFNIVPTEE